MTDDPKEILMEEAVSAYRERTTAGRILPSPAWWDLPEESRAKLFQLQLQSRILESAIAPDGMCSTVKSVFKRIKSI